MYKIHAYVPVQKRILRVEGKVREFFELKKTPSNSQKKSEQVIQPNMADQVAMTPFQKIITTKHNYFPYFN